MKCAAFPEACLDALRPGSGPRYSRRPVARELDHDEEADRHMGVGGRASLGLLEQDGGDREAWSLDCFNAVRPNAALVE